MTNRDERYYYRDDRSDDQRSERRDWRYDRPDRREWREDRPEWLSRENRPYRAENYREDDYRTEAVIRPMGSGRSSDEQWRRADRYPRNDRNDWVDRYDTDRYRTERYVVDPGNTEPVVERRTRAVARYEEHDEPRLTPIHSLTGRGPKNYRRSDERIREDVSEELTYHHEVDASDIEVMVDNGEVTLTGTVDERRQKRLAEDIAESVRGVRDVHNRIRVREGDRGDTGRVVAGTTGTSGERDYLVKLSNSDLSLAEGAADIRSRKVLDRNGDEIGHVEDLLIDPDERKVRFLDVHYGGFLGLGEKRTLIPVDAVTRITDDAVHVDQTREHVGRGPAYDPNLSERNDRDYYSPYYSYYGYAPFWGAGYVYPPYPYY